MFCKAAHAFSSSGLSQTERLATQVTLVDASSEAKKLTPIKFALSLSKKN